MSFVKNIDDTIKHNQAFILAATMVTASLIGTLADKYCVKILSSNLTLPETFGACAALAMPFVVSCLIYTAVDRVAKNKIAAFVMALIVFVPSAYLTCILLKADVLAGISITVISTVFALVLCMKGEEERLAPPIFGRI
jgi:hypothetical protein